MLGLFLVILTFILQVLLDGGAVAPFQLRWVERATTTLNPMFVLYRWKNAPLYPQ
ncbi:hypothetical protein BDN72DRAFT_846294 [Pluteus cervinus]|uniref:Uncharacterized protein n=1 Tax=Pluteus cervinus TaxID=181527 RepID=A0ACD3AGP7_9AGAR|nr:hypothetical protein BDN72DRAFT_846294 [Pluteus cervinus]